MCFYNVNISCHITISHDCYWIFLCSMLNIIFTIIINKFFYYFFASFFSLRKRRKKVLMITSQDPHLQETISYLQHRIFSRIFIHHHSHSSYCSHKLKTFLIFSILSSQYFSATPGGTPLSNSNRNLAKL